MPVLGVPTNKCPHGVYLAGEAKARYCSGCNPNIQAARGVRRVMQVDWNHDKRELDVTEFISRPMGERLAAIQG